jgi:maleylacetoacetate isomerase
VKLYTYFRSSAAYRVRIALALKGLPYESLPVNLIKGGQDEAAFRAVNPQGRVPVLDVDGDVLTQSPAILEYLEECYPDPPLLPTGPLARARVRAACAIIACDVHPLNNIGALRYLKRRMGQDQASIDAWCTHWIREGFSALEDLLQPGPFAFGSHPTLADVYLVPQVYNARRLNVSLDEYPNIAAVDGACATLAEFLAARPDNQIDAA